MNAIDLLGTLMNSGMSRSGSRRIENSIGSSGIGEPGGVLGQLLGGAGGSAAGSGGLVDMLGKVAGSLSQGGSGGAVPGGMGAGAGGGVLGSLAPAALRNLRVLTIRRGWLPGCANRPTKRKRSRCWMSPV